MIEKLYKTRRDAEEHRKKGDSIYFVSDKGYYLVPSKRKLANEYDRGWWHGTITTIIIISLSFIVGRIF